MKAPSASPSHLPVRRHTWLVAVLACIAVFLFTDKSRDTDCIHNVSLYGVVVLPHNCDSVSISDKLLSADRFYTEFHNWKGRPVYHAYGFVAGNALVPFAFPLWAVLAPGAEAKAQLRRFAGSFNFHIAYFLLNIGVVIACAWAAIRISGLDIRSWAAVALAASLASTDLVEGGVWLLHTNIFNLVSAFGTLLFAVLGMQRTILTRAVVLTGGFLIGLGILVYPAIAIAAPGYIAGRLIGRFKVANDRTPLAGEAAEIALFAVAAAAPVVAWWGLNRFVFETATYLTAEKGQFSWLPEAWSEGRFGDAFRYYAGNFRRAVLIDSGAEYGLALIAIAILALYRGVSGVRMLAGDPVVWAVLVAMAGVLSFNFLQGYYVARLQVGALYLLYVIVARLAHIRRMEGPGVLCLGVIAGYQLVNAILTYSVTGT